MCALSTPGFTRLPVTFGKLNELSESISSGQKLWVFNFVIVKLKEEVLYY
ncbi:MAG: hypothetical protein ABI723_03115 [Bacteroidia bacterium]